MRLPFLQLDSDFAAHGASAVAALLGVKVPAALGHVALLRAWAVSRGPDDAPPDGWVPGANAAKLVAAGAQWEGDASVFVGALSDPAVGILDVQQGGIRVLGLDCYAKAWTRAEESKERARIARERSADVRARNADVSRQTQTQTQIDKEASASQEPVPIPERPALVLTAQKPGRQPRKPSAAESLFQRLQETRRDRCVEVGEAFVDEGWPHARRNRDLKPILEAEDAARQLFQAAWAIYLASDDERAREPAWSLSYFMNSGVRAKYETKAAREAA